MPFSNAIPVNRMSSAFTGYGASQGKEFASRSRVFTNQSKQSVNISKETLTRVAREKLGSALQTKMAYNRFGATEASVARVGLRLSTHA